MSHVYILTNQHKNVLYVGSTDDLKKRIYLHRNRLLPGFTKKYNVTILVYYEFLPTPEAALEREKQIKKHKREKKDSLIQKFNPYWIDLYKTL